MEVVCKAIPGRWDRDSAEIMKSILDHADRTGSGVITRGDGMEFVKQCGLPRAALDRMWELVFEWTRGEPASDKMTLVDFSYFLLFIGCAQFGVSCSREKVMTRLHDRKYPPALTPRSGYVSLLPKVISPSLLQELETNLGITEMKVIQEMEEARQSGTRKRPLLPSELPSREFSKLLRFLGDDTLPFERKLAILRRIKLEEEWLVLEGKERRFTPKFLEKTQQVVAMLQQSHAKAKQTWACTKPYKRLSKKQREQMKKKQKEAALEAYQGYAAPVDVEDSEMFPSGHGDLEDLMRKGTEPSQLQVPGLWSDSEDEW